MSKKTIVGNWKMHLNVTEASLLVHRLSQKIDHKSHVEVVLCPSFIALQPLAKELSGRSKFKLGAQNAHYLDEGAYTGEVSPAQLKGLADYVIIGHSERRQHTGENDNEIAKKLAAAVRNGLTPILCVGDTLLDHHHGLAKKVVIDQLSSDLSILTADEIKGMLIAYEPVWAIGTGDFAKPDDVMPIASAIRHTIEELYGEAAGADVQVLYGGSVEPDNCRAYLELDGIDGLLVGGASLNYEKFADIVKVAQELAVKA